MESPREDRERPAPTEQDRENERIRREIALRQETEYRKCEILSLRKLGPGWEPWMKLSLFRIEDCGPTGKDDPPRIPVTVAFKVRRGEGDERMDRYLRETETGEILCGDRYEDVFGGLLDEKHPTRTMEVKGAQVPTKRFQLYWSGLELYHPRSAEQLAVLRATREQNKAEREERKWREGHPLLAYLEDHPQAEETEVEDTAPEPDPPRMEPEPQRGPPVQRELF